MIDDKWEDWTEPLEALLSSTKVFLDTLKAISQRIHELPEGGKLVEAPEIYTRKEGLAQALSAFLWVPRKIWTTDFLDNYIYVSDVYEDVIGFVFEYIGESEHQMDLHGDEFAQTILDLREDFALYVKGWTSPYWRSLE